MRWSLVPVVLLALAGASVAHAQSGFNIRGTRPRLLIAERDVGGAPRTLQQLDAYLAGAGAERLARLKASPTTGEDALANVALRKRLDPADPVDVTGALEAMEALAAVAQPDPEQVLRLALAFDWLYDEPALGAELK
ncbi:MAG: hypothetical protein ACK4N5_17280, partial [Myxococcales bacterium]